MVKRGDVERDFIVLIKIASVTGVTAMGNEGRLYFLIINLDPVDRLEPAVLLDVHATVPQIAVSSRQVHLQDVLQHIPQFLAEMMCELILARDDLLVNLHRIVREERRVSRVHLVDQYAEAPPVDGLAIALR